MTELQRLQTIDWKMEHRDEVLQYHKDYYKKNKASGRWAYIPVALEDRKRMKGRQPKVLIGRTNKGKKEVKRLEAYTFAKLNHNHLGIAKARCGRLLGSKNSKEPVSLQVEKSVGTFMIEFS